MVLLIKMLRKRRLITFGAVCSSGLTVVVTLWWNVQLRDMINMVSTGNPLPMDVIALALVTVTCMVATSYVKGYVSGLACEALTHDLRMGYARYFSLLPVIEIERLNAGEQLSKLQNEISDVSDYLNDHFFQIMDDGVRFIMTLIWLLTLNARLTLTLNLPVLVILIYVFHSSKMIGDATERSQQAKGRMNQYADTLLTLFPIVRLYDASRLLLFHYENEVKAWQGQTVRAERIRARLMSLSGLLSNIPLTLLLMAGGSMAIHGTLTIGTLYIFLNLSGNVSGVMMNMPGFIAAFRRFLVNMKRLTPKMALDGRGE